MRIGISVGLQLNGPQTITDVVDEVRQAADLGLDSAWWSQVMSWDALTSLAVAGREVPELSLGTAVVTTYPRHPVALASQALSAQAATGNRLTLGIGPSHAPMVETTLGLNFDRPALHTRELLSTLVPLLRGEEVDFHGEIHTVSGQVSVPGATPPPVLVAALGPVMLRTAGELADGTIVTWTGVRTITEHIVPRITAAAEAAGRPRPRVVLSLPITVTDDVDAANQWINERLGMAADLPSYRAMLDIEGAAGVTDVVIAGDEREVESRLQQYEDAGATEFVAVPFGPQDQVRRTHEVLSGLAR